MRCLQDACLCRHRQDRQCTPCQGVQHPDSLRLPAVPGYRYHQCGHNQWLQCPHCHWGHPGGRGCLPEPLEECDKGFLSGKGHCSIIPEWWCLQECQSSADQRQSSGQTTGLTWRATSSWSDWLGTWTSSEELQNLLNQLLIPLL